MARYRKIDPRIWNDEKFRTFTNDGKLAFIFVLTHPHLTALGAMRGTLDGLARELGWSPRRFRVALADAIRHGIVDVNEASAYVGLTNFLRFNEPEGPNSVIHAWVEALDRIPECDERRALIKRCGAYLSAKSPEFKSRLGDAIGHAFGMPCPILELELEPELEPELKEQKDQDQLHRPSGSVRPPRCGDADLVHRRPPLPPASTPEAPSPTGAGVQSSREPATSKPTGGRRVRVASDDAFEKFYARYPKKVKVRDAQRAWALAVKTTTPAEILAGLERQLPDLEALEWRFRLHPASWLGAESWLDEAPGGSNGNGAAPTIPPEWLEADGCPLPEFRDRVPQRHPCPLHRGKWAQA